MATKTFGWLIYQTKIEELESIYVPVWWCTIQRVNKFVTRIHIKMGDKSKYYVKTFLSRIRAFSNVPICVGTHVTGDYYFRE